MSGLPPRAAELLRLVHARPGLPRTDASRALGVGTGTTTSLVARLVAARLVAELAAARTGARGRPTTLLGPHPQGPLVAVGLVSHRGWRARLVEIGGTVVDERSGGSLGERDGAPVVAAVRRAVDEMAERVAGRVLAAGLAVPGPVRDDRWVDAALLGWSEQDVPVLWPDTAGPGARVPLRVLGNDATLAAVGEARRGAARSAHTHLHLVLEIGMGGAVTSHGTALEGFRGAAGEFGHLPFGDPGLVCPCGATGCWGKTLDGSALARALGRPDPEDAAAYSSSVLDLAEGGDTGALAAVAVQAASLGRGTAGLVNALDPALVTLGGLATRLLMVAPAVTHDAYRRGLMSHRRQRPPELVPGALGDDAPLVGAAERVWDRLLADGLGGWPPVG
jgi:predicted NBD/HSP70 family sugar kinase